MTRTFTLLTLIWSSPLHCGSEASSPSAPTPEPEPHAEEPSALAAPEPIKPAHEVEARMRDHFAATSRVVDAVVDGDLDGAQEAAAALLEQVSEDGLPPQWSEHVVNMRSAARAVVDANDIAGAGIQAGTMLATCGHCHASVGARPAFPPALTPSSAATAAGEMERHQWALERLSEGLVGPSDEAWAAGAELLDRPPVCAKAIAEEVGDARTVGAVADRFHALSMRTAKTRGPARGRLYGELLGTCAACHQSGC